MAERKLSLKVLIGDITEQDTEAIVNNSNEHLTLDIGFVSKAIRNKSPSTQAELQKYPTPAKRAATFVTSGGNLRCKKIIHVVMCEQIYECVQACLKAAEYNHLASVTFPLLGVGKFGLSAEKTSEAMLVAMIDYVQRYPPICLELIQVAIYGEEANNHLKIFEGIMKNPAQVGSNLTPAKRTFLETIFKRDPHEWHIPYVLSGRGQVMPPPLPREESAGSSNPLDRRSSLSEEGEEGAELYRRSSHEEGKQQRSNVVHPLPNRTASTASGASGGSGGSRSSSEDTGLTRLRVTSSYSEPNNDDDDDDDVEEEEEEEGDDGDDDNVDVTLTNLSNKSHEFGMVATEIKASADGTVTIHKIYKIQNSTILKEYEKRRTDMDESNPDGTINERILYCPAPASENKRKRINRRGVKTNNALNLDTIDYGPGVYFFVKADQALKHCERDKHGFKYVYKCRVLTGLTTQSRRGPRRTLSGSGSSSYFTDSFVNNSATPQIFVVAKENRVYADQVITFC